MSLEDVLGPHTVAVGALEGLAAEITVIDGAAHLAEVRDASSPDGLQTRTVVHGDRATLLVAADVPTWTEHSLGPVSDLTSLAEEIRTVAIAAGIGNDPFPFRVEGTADSLALHVLDHSCPIADPDGPSPWRFSGQNEQVQLVGFYAEGAGGRLTHHGRRTHTHVVLPTRGISGHLDAISFKGGARLYLPDF